MRDATSRRRSSCRPSRYFNPRTPVRDATGSCYSQLVDFFISIHAPLCGMRPRTICSCQSISSFQSTHPYAGCDAHAAGLYPPVPFVSIHARYLLECDILTSLQLQGRPVFCFRARIALLSVGDTVSLRPPPPLVCFYAFLPPPSLFSLEAGDSRRY